MIGSKEFYESLIDGEEYAIIIMREEHYKECYEYLNDKHTLSIKEHNTAFKNDPVHLHLAKKVSKARRDLNDYEFDTNHK